MECQFCGEEIPLNSSVCPSCGNRADQFFLTEEVRGSRLSKSTKDIPPARRMPSPRQQVGFSGRWKTAGVIAGSIALILIAIFAAMTLTGGEHVPVNAEEAVSGYYEALARSDLSGMESCFAKAFLPPVRDMKGIEEVVGETTYRVVGPNLRTVSEGAGEATVEIEDVQVDYTNPDGETVKHALSTDVLQPLRLKRPGIRVLVRVMNEGDGWFIADRPMNGWSAENIWLLGQLGTI